jgi:hypothetical protein
MRNGRVILQRIVAFSVIALVGALGLSGCSSVGPEDAWSGSTASLEGAVRDPDGVGISEIEISLWCEGSDGTVYTYETTTDANGDFWFEDVALASEHPYYQEYVISVNRTRNESERIDSGYGIYQTTVTVSAFEVATIWVTLEPQEDPVNPEIFIG